MGAGGLMYATQVEPDWLDVVSVTLSLPRLDPAFSGFRLVQISDIHISEAITGQQVAEACRRALDWKPDLVAITGDFVDDRRNMREMLEDLANALRPLTDEVQTVAVLGNHDYRMGAYQVRQMLEGLKIHELMNQVLTLTREDTQFHIAGVDDPWRGHPQLSKVLNKLPERGSAILLAHEPDYADISAATKRFDLQLSGHSHGGQVVLPLLGPPILPRLGEKYPSGLYQVKGMLQYTNRGLGMTEPHIRFNCRPEITFITLQPEQA